jgi:tRNA threonylcarbamoyladenosine biosynthesis protein TsaE
MNQHTTSSPSETIDLGREFASRLLAPMLVLLRGDLGAGKTTLVKGIAEGFHAAKQEDVTSPTFTLVHEYRATDVTLYHIDLYRIDTQKELDTLALDDLMTDNSILLIEWGEKFARFRDECDVEIAIDRLSENQRRIAIRNKNTRNST